MISTGSQAGSKRNSFTHGSVCWRFFMPTTALPSLGKMVCSDLTGGGGGGKESPWEFIRKEKTPVRGSVLRNNSPGQMLPVQFQRMTGKCPASQQGRKRKSCLSSRIIHCIVNSFGSSPRKGILLTFLKVSNLINLDLEWSLWKLGKPRKWVFFV